MCRELHHIIMRGPREGESRELLDTDRASVLSLQIYTDWANHYLAKSGCPRLIKDLSQDIPDGVLLAQIIQIIANEKVEDINGSPRSQSQMPPISLPSVNSTQLEPPQPP
ncbi:unnamed protein product [Pleuronectes platessa]|uniref:Calponin-homology (CH) domain-containing protein n=1 Tax=Pleuronectes platessa TaxID=8262 RepID=A0A9N7UCE5_PLEPL|nr:unnamed protein product [Pleuronectes platessa]